MRKVAFEDAGMAPATVQLLQAAAQLELIRDQPILRVGVRRSCGSESRSRVPVDEISTR